LAFYLRPAIIQRVLLGICAVGIAAGSGYENQQRQTEHAPAVDLLADGEQIAGQRSAGRVANVDFQPDARHAQVGPHESVGEVQRRELSFFENHLFGPGLIE
jgi:hypothetical protein